VSQTNPIPPEQVSGGPYLIDSVALDQEYGVPQEVVDEVATDLMLAVTGEGYAEHEVVFVGGKVGESGEFEFVPDDPAPDDEGETNPPFMFWTAGDLAATAEEQTNPIHFAGTTATSRIAVLDFMGIDPGNVPPIEGGVRYHVDPQRLRDALTMLFHPQYEAETPDRPDPHDLIGSMEDPEFDNNGQEDQR
jgi:hypothetical protein